jgi:hypothetical protein
MTTQTATYVGDCSQPAPQSKGIAYPASGFYDPQSAAYGAWLFKPNGDENAYYVNEDDLRFD